MLAKFESFKVNVCRVMTVFQNLCKIVSSHALNEAKYNLGKVKRKTMQYRTSGVAQGTWQGLPWLRLQLHFMPADLCSSFAIVLWRIITDSRSCCIMNR